MDFGSFSTVFFFEILCPELPCGSEFGHLFPQVSEYIEIKSNPRATSSTERPAGNCFVNVTIGNFESKTDLLGRVGAGFPDMVSADGYRITTWQES